MPKRMRCSSIGIARAAQDSWSRAAAISTRRDASRTRPASSSKRCSTPCAMCLELLETCDACRSRGAAARFPARFCRPTAGAASTLLARSAAGRTFVEKRKAQPAHGPSPRATRSPRLGGALRICLPGFPLAIPIPGRSCERWGPLSAELRCRLHPCADRAGCGATASLFPLTARTPPAG